MPATRRERIRLARPAPTLSLLERECGESSPPTSPVPQGEAAREIVPEHKGMLAGAASRAPSSSRSCSPLHCRSSPSVPPAQEPASPRSCTCSSSGSRSHEWLLKPLPRTKRTTRAQGRQRPGRRHRVRPSPFVCAGGPSPVGEGSSGAIVVAIARQERTRSRARQGRPFDSARGDGDWFVAAGTPLPSQFAEDLGATDCMYSPASPVYSEPELVSPSWSSPELYEGSRRRRRGVARTNVEWPTPPDASSLLQHSLFVDWGDQGPRRRLRDELDLAGRSRWAREEGGGPDDGERDDEASANGDATDEGCGRSCARGLKFPERGTGRGRG